MKVLLIPDKFKGSLSAVEVIEAIRKGILKVFPETIFHCIQASDGGDGFLDAVSTNLDCEVVKVDTFDPFGRDIKAEYLCDTNSNSAYIEVAKASGLEVVKETERDVMQASTFGTGLLIKDAILKGNTSIYLGLGGSATNDAGLGIAEALDFYFLDSNGNQLATQGKNLSNINSIHKKSNSISLKGISFFAVNDVDNPLYGSEGAAYTYAKQKGASPKEIEELDCGLKDFANVVQLQTKKDVASLPGSGAAGGAAYGLKVFCNAKFIRGSEFLFDISKIKELLAENNFDYIITGEGKFDNQTLHGKLVKGVIDLGKQFEVPVLVICGQIDLDKKILEKFENLTVLEINKVSKSLDYNIQNTETLIVKSIQSYLKK